MSFFSTNIRLLRERRRVTQDIVARSIEMTRSTINSLENGSVKNPTISVLLKLSDYYKVPIDALIRIDMSKLSPFKLNQFIKTNEASWFQ